MLGKWLSWIEVSYVIALRRQVNINSSYPYNSVGVLRTAICISDCCSKSRRLHSNWVYPCEKKTIFMYATNLRDFSRRAGFSLEPADWWPKLTLTSVIRCSSRTLQLVIFNYRQEMRTWWPEQREALLAQLRWFQLYAGAMDKYLILWIFKEFASEFLIIINKLCS